MLELFAYLGENGIRDIALMDDLRFPQKPQAYRFACGRYGITPRCYDFQYGDLASEEACIDGWRRNAPSWSSSGRIMWPR